MESGHRSTPMTMHNLPTGRAVDQLEALLRAQPHGRILVFVCSWRDLDRVRDRLATLDPASRVSIHHAAAAPVLRRAS